LAYEYVRWGEKQRTPDGTSWPEVPSVKGRKVWWLVREPTFPVGIWPKAFNDRFFILENDSKVACSDRFYEIELKEGTDAESFMAFLNSTLMALTLELRGRVNLGDGALDNMAYEAAEAMVLNPSVVDPKAMRNLVRAYKKVKQRPIGIIKEELKQPDRQELDKAVLEALGLDPKGYLRPLYEGLVELVTERLKLSEMRATQPKAEKRLSDEKLLEKWKKEGWPQRIKPIDYFVASDGDSFREVALTGRPVRYASRAYDLFSEATDAKGKAISRIVLMDAKDNPVGDVATTWEAKYVLYAARPNRYLVRLPSQEAKVKEVVKRYEEHLRREGEELLRDMGEAVRDHKAAERLFRRLLEEAGLPKLAIDVALGGKA
jgi:hypothetical protein